jgi:ssRNA-specific RNase YbeY (16S rRNA maturation enzyme)
MEEEQKKAMREVEERVLSKLGLTRTNEWEVDILQ